MEAIEGVLRLDGHVPSLSHCRLAEVIRLVFDKDSPLDAASINPQVEDAVVVLRGYVCTAEQAERAERNCWFIPGMHEVRNELSMP